MRSVTFSVSPQNEYGPCKFLSCDLVVQPGFRNGKEHFKMRLDKRTIILRISHGLYNEKQTALVLAKKVYFETTDV